MSDDTQDISPEEDITSTGEDTVDDIELEDAEASKNDKLKQLRDKLKQSGKEKQEHLENLQRSKAEFLNARKRLEEQQLLNTERITDQHIEKLLPLCDSFQMAMADKATWDEIDATWRTGIESIHTQLQSLLTGYHVTVINPENMHFDPARHEAMITQEVEGVAADTVVKVLQYGYERNGELIRPAKVILST